MGNHRERVETQKPKESSGNPTETLHYNSPQEMGKPDIPQREAADMCKQMELLRREHSKQLEDQEQKNKEDLDSLRIELNQKNKMKMETLKKEMEKLKEEVADRNSNQTRKTERLDSEERAREGAIPKTRNLNHNPSSILSRQRGYRTKVHTQG